MKKLFSVLLLAFLCAIPARATTITVSAYQLTNLPFNPTNIGGARTFTVTATNGSAAITSSAAFPTNIVGIAGFQVLFSGDSTQYVVSGVASTSGLTLTTTFSGSTGSKTMTLYPYVLLRTYATMGFQDNVTGQNVQPGTPGSGNFYKQVAVSIINTGSGNVAWMPEFTIPSTTDAVINNQARYVFGFYRPDGSLLSYYLCGSVQQLAIPATTPTTWTAICNYNAPGAIVPPNTEAYTKPQIDQRFPSCTAGQLAYYAATGNIQACLSVGGGLQISGNTLSATGGGGGSPTLTATFVGYGNGSNVLTGTSDFTYATSTKTLSIINGSGASTLVLNGTSDTSSVKFGSASLPGTQGGIFFPFVGGGMSNGPGVWWGSSASYGSLSGIYLNNGFTFQGANSTHDQVKIAEATGSSSNGTVRFLWQPSSSLYTQTGSFSSTGLAGEVVRWDVSSTGTAAANFGAYASHRLENGSGTQIEAVRLSSTWQTATAGAETGRYEIATNLAGLGIGAAFTVEGGQNYGTLWDKGTISGSVTLDFANGNTVTATLTGNVTSLAFSNLRTGGVYYIHFIQNALGPWTLTVPAALKVEGGYVITATVNARDLLICSATSTSQLYCAKAQNQQ